MWEKMMTWKWILQHKIKKDIKALTTREENTLKRELRPLQKINDHYPKYILTMDNDLDADYEGIKKVKLIDWLLDK